MLPKKTLYDRLLPQAREIIEKEQKRLPSITEMIFKALKDESKHFWTELPYYVVKMIHERVYNASFDDPIDEEEVKMLFQDYYEQSAPGEV